jgi:hypothetical protein
LKQSRPQACPQTRQRFFARPKTIDGAI